MTDLPTLRTAISDTAQAIAKATEWQPIETAPKDGTIILAADKSYGVVIARWENAEAKILCDEDDDDHFPAEWCIIEIQSGDMHWDAALTHWMPLPPPPAIEGM